MVNSKKAKNHPWTNIWRIDEVSPDDLDNLNADNYSIRLFNIGTSSAKDVVVEWEYPFDDLIEKVNHLCQVSLQDFYLHRTLGDFVETESNNPAVLGFTMRTTAGMSTGREYILPVALSSEPTLIPVPRIFRLLYSIVAGLALHRTENWESLLQEVGAAKLRLRFTDLDGTKYERILCCRLVLSMASEDAFSGELMFTAEN